MARVLTLLSVLAGVFCSASPGSAAETITWQTDYAAARKAADEQKRPLLVVVNSENCYYCRKMDANTFTDPKVISLINSRFIALKVDGNRDPEFTRALRVTLYPTCVLATTQGDVIGFLQGYLAPDQFLLNAEKALEIIKPAEIASAATSPSVAAKVTATPTSFSKNSTALQADSSFPKMLLQAAREAYRRERLGECLERCAEVIDGHKDSPEAAEAVVLHQLIASQPEKMLVAQREIDERLTRRYLVLGDQWREKQNLNEARKCYEKALSLSPVPVLASQARTRLEDLKTFMK